MISVLWDLNPNLGGKDIFGTYWMWYRADMFELKRQFKELARLRKEIGNSYIGNAIDFIWKLISVYFPMSLLNSAAVVFFVARILAFRFGFLKGSFKTNINSQTKKEVKTIKATASCLRFCSQH